MKKLFANLFIALAAHAAILLEAQAQMESFVGEIKFAAVNFVEEINFQVAMQSSNTVIPSQTTLVPAAIVLSQAAVENSTGDEAEENGGIYEDEEDDELATKNASPVAIDSNLQSGSSIGNNTQTALSRPKGVNTSGRTGFFPSVTLGISTENNPTRTNGERAANTTDTVVALIARLPYRNAINNRHTYELSVAARKDLYDQFTNLDADSVALEAAINFDVTEIVQGDLYISHVESNDRRGGTATRELGPIEPNDEYETDNIGGRVTFGRRSNVLQLVLGVDQKDIKYTNNNQGHRDRGDSTVNAGLYWNVGSRTSIFLRERLTDIDYKQESQSGFDSEEFATTVGLGWEPSYSTSLVF